MRLSPEILSDICSWPYHPTEPYISPKSPIESGDMAEEKLLDSVMQLARNRNKERDSVLQLMLPNAGNESVLESDLNSAKNTDLIVDETNHTISSMRNWSDGDIGPIGLESDEPSYPNSPNSPKKLSPDSGQNLPEVQSPKTLTLETVCSNNLAKKDDTKASTINRNENQIVSEDTNATPSIFLSCINVESECSNFNVQCNCLKTISQCLNDVEEIVDGHADETDDRACRFNWENCEARDEDRSCDDFSDDGTLSAYYIPSTASVVTDEFYSQPPMAPPRTSRAGRLRRDQTQSEADACTVPVSARSFPYKSLRSKSDPSTHYTTVIKPTAIRPAAINIDAFENDSSLESLQLSAEFMQHSRDQRSAFRQHLRTNLGHGNDGSLVIFSRSLEASLPNGNEELVFDEANGSNSPLSPTRRYSFNDASNERSFEGRKRYSLAAENVLQPTEQNNNLPSISNPNLGSGEDNLIRKRHTMPSDINGHLRNSSSMSPLLSSQSGSEPIHMTLEEVRSTIQAGAAASKSTDNQDQSPEDEKKSPCRQFFRVYFRPRKSKKNSSKQTNGRNETDKVLRLHLHHNHRRSFPSSMKAAISNWFGLRRSSSDTTPIKKNTNSDDRKTTETVSTDEEGLVGSDELSKSSVNTSPFTNRALPPLPVDGDFLWEPSVRVIDDETSSLSASSVSSESDNIHNRTKKMDYAASIEKVKDCGWYWGPISGETAEKLLANEPDGSFVVRDSSDEHYIFSLTFKLNGFVRHVRIEHDHGNFSFGCQQKFRSNTIVDFIENAVEHSRSGRYLFFLHRRPVLGPMRVQLLHPVSRFKQVQSLQHLCRFIILKSVRRDLIDSLPLPRCLRHYLNTQHYYSEELAHLSSVAATTPASSRNSVASVPS